MKLESALKEQYKLLHHSPRLYAKAVRELLRAKMSNNMFREEEALKKLATLIGDSNVLANLLGRRRALLEFEQFKKRDQPHRRTALFAEGQQQPVIPTVTYEMAVQDLISRPVYGDKLKLGWMEAQKLYTGEHAFALAKTTDAILTKKIQELIVKSMEEGEDMIDASQAVAELGDFTEAYAETIYRTNLTQSYVSGRFEEANDPEIAEVIGGMMFSALLDPVTRPNHRAAEGLIAGTNDPIWNKLKPPLGFNCRCTVVMMDKFTLDEYGLISPGGEVSRGWKLSSGAVTKVAPAEFALAGPDARFIAG